MEQMRDGMDEMLELEERRAGIRLLLLFLVLAAGFIASLAVGRYYIPVSEILAAFSGGQVADKTSQVLMVVRLPRVLAAVLVGGAMSVSGAAYQGMFKNPLVSPTSWAPPPEPASEPPWPSCCPWVWRESRARPFSSACSR